MGVIAEALAKAGASDASTDDHAFVWDKVVRIAAEIEDDPRSPSEVKVSAVCTFNVADEWRTSEYCGRETMWAVFGKQDDPETMHIGRCDDHAGCGLNREVIDRIVPWPPISVPAPRINFPTPKRSG